MKKKKQQKRIRIHTYLHTTLSSSTDSILPEKLTYLFAMKRGEGFRLYHTFTFESDKFIRDFARSLLAQSKNVMAVHIEQHIFNTTNSDLDNWER